MPKDSVGTENRPTLTSRSALTEPWVLQGAEAFSCDFSRDGPAVREPRGQGGHGHGGWARAGRVEVHRLRACAASLGSLFFFNFPCLCSNTLTRHRI